MLKCKFIRYKNVVLYEVLEQDEDIRGKRLIYKDKNGVKIYSEGSPEICTSELYIRGTRKDRDYSVNTLRFDSEEDASQAISNFSEAIQNYNKTRQNEKESNDLKITIAE